MMCKTQRRYSDDKARKLFAEALELIQKNYCYKFQQVATIQDVSRQTYLRLSERSEDLKDLYRKLKQALEKNIQIALMMEIITPRQAMLIERNYTKRWIGK